ncbi:hypothetical protein LINPERHAP2_LOCUS9590 [Linum perenne]
MAKDGGPVSREYKSWSKQEEAMLVTCMRELVDERQVEKGNFKLSHLKALQRMMHTRLEGCQLLAEPHIKSKVRYMKDKFSASLQLKEASGFGWDEARGCVVADDEVFSGWSHPKASGLNNKPLPQWDDLCFIFGAQTPTGADAVQPGDETSRVNARARQSEYMDIGMEQVDSYTIPSNIDHNVVMEELINQGIDMHATSLKDLEAEITSTNAAEKGKQTGASSGSKRSRQLFTEDDRARIISTMAATSENIARIADTFCVEGELAVRRQILYQELCTFPDLNQAQRRTIMRHLNRDDADATIYFQLPTSEEKLAFVRSFLE